MVFVENVVVDMPDLPITKGNKKLKPSPLEILQNFVEAWKSMVLYIYIYIYKQRFFGVKILSE